MKVQQLSVFIENKAGRVSEVAGALGAAGVNIRGFSVADTADYGILRLVVDKPEGAKTALKVGGFTVKETDVICIWLEDVPGSLARVLRTVADAGVNVEYLYSLVSTYVVLNVSDADAAIARLEGRQVRLISQEEISGI